MIHFTKDLYKFKTYRDLDAFKRKNSIDSIDDEKEFIKIHEKGEDIYCCIAPVVPDLELEEENVLMWDRDADDLIDQAFHLMELI